MKTGASPPHASPPARKAPAGSGAVPWHKRARAFWLKIHLYIALSAGALFVLLGLTGSVNVFYRELEELGSPAPAPAGASAPPRSLDEIAATLRAAHPQRPGSWTLVLPGYGKSHLWAIYKNPEETRDEFYGPLRVLVDLYSGEIVKESFWGQTLWTLIYEFHADFLTGKLGPVPGRLGFDIVCLLGLPFLVSSLTGLYLWWPRPGKFLTAVTLKKRASPERFYFDLHRATGFYAAAVLVILTFSGFSFGYREFLEALIDPLSPVRPGHLQAPELKPEPPATGTPLSIARIVAIADTRFPAGELRAVELPDGPQGVYAVEKRQRGEANRIRPRTKLWIDPYSGKILAVQDPNEFTAGETFLNLLWPLHSGEAFGLPGRIAWCLIGLAPLILYLSGLVRWLQKRKAAKRSSAARSRSHSRGIINEYPS